SRYEDLSSGHGLTIPKLSETSHFGLRQRVCGQGSEVGQLFRDVLTRSVTVLLAFQMKIVVVDFPLCLESLCHLFPTFNDNVLADPQPGDKTKLMRHELAFFEYFLINGSASRRLPIGTDRILRSTVKYH